MPKLVHGSSEKVDMLRFGFSSQSGGGLLGLSLGGEVPTFFWLEDIEAEEGQVEGSSLEVAKKRFSKACSEAWCRCQVRPTTEKDRHRIDCGKLCKDYTL